MFINFLQSKSVINFWSKLTVENYELTKHLEHFQALLDDGRTLKVYYEDLEVFTLRKII